MITLKFLFNSSLWLSTFQRATEFDISFNSLSVCLPSILNRNSFWQQSWGSLFPPWQKNPGIYLSDFLSLSRVSFFPRFPSLPADPLIPLLPLKNRKWNSFFPSSLSLTPFITQKPWFPAMTVSHSPNELILHEGRIPSYLSRVLSDTHSLSLPFLHYSLLLSS